LPSPYGWRNFLSLDKCQSLLFLQLAGDSQRYASDWPTSSALPPTLEELMIGPQCMMGWSLDSVRQVAKLTRLRVLRVEKGFPGLHWSRNFMFGGPVPREQSLADFYHRLNIVLF
jgi:hypothetical protein